MLNKDKVLANIVVQEAIRKAKKEERTITLNYAIAAMTASMMLVLKDTHGFGAKRCQRALAAFEEQFAAINEGYLSLNDIQKTVAEELDIDIQGSC